jgi:guanylate kinase
VHNQQLSCLDIKEVQKLNNSQIGLIILIVQTEIELRALNKNLQTIFIVPPDLGTLLSRMQAGREVTNDEIKRRLEAAKIELQIARTQADYYCIVNDNISEMTDQAQKFLETGERDGRVDQSGRAAIERVLLQLEKS